MTGHKSIVRYASISERKKAWAENREAYNEWRKSDEGRSFVKRQRSKQYNMCFICLTPMGKLVHVDHIMPLYYGGTSNKVNMALTHPECNMKKGSGFLFSPKQACQRRKIFNDIRKGLSTTKTMHKKPDFIPSKRAAKAIKVAEQYLGDLEEYLGYKDTEEEYLAEKLYDMFRQE